MGDYTPVQSDQSAFTSTASATITGGQLLSASGSGTVAPSAVGDHSIGIAAFDAASGQRVTVYVLPGMVHEATVVAAGTATAGTCVITGAAGTVNNAATLGGAAAAGTLIGIFLTSAAAGAKARFVGV
jgi:hypothetical protein